MDYKIKRGISFMIDLIIMGCMTIPLMLIDMKTLAESGISKIYIAAVMLVVIILRDTFHKAPGKYFVRLSLRDKKTGKKPKLWKILIRNAVLPLWMVDALVLLIKKEKFSDILLGVEVVDDQSESTTNVEGAQ